METPSGGHRLPDNDEMKAPSAQRQVEILCETLATLNELPDTNPKKAPAIENTMARIALIEKDNPEAKPN